MVRFAPLSVRRHLCRWLAVLLLLCGGAARALTVAVLGAGPGSEPFVAELQDRLGSDNRVVTTSTPDADLVVALHEGVLADARAQRRPSLLLLPEPGATHLQADETAIYWAPSLSGQLRLAQQILPGLRRVGLLVRSQDLERARALRDAVLPRRVELLVREADPGQLARQVADLAAGTDLLLAPFDNALFNRRNVRAVLLAAYRQQRALIGPDAAYVHAGALASLYATPATLAADVARCITLFQRDGHWPAPSHVTRFDVVTNPQVARALGIALPDAAALTRVMQSEQVVVWP